MFSDDFVLDDGPDTVILQVKPEGVSRNLSSKALPNVNINRFTPALYDKKAQDALGDALLRLLAEVSLEAPVMIQEDNNKMQRKGESRFQCDETVQ